MKKTGLVLGCVGALALSGTVFAADKKEAATQEKQVFSPEQVTAIEQVVHDYLLNNPELMIEVGKKLQEKAEAGQQQQATKAIADNKDKIFTNKNSPNFGPTTGARVVEFFDYQCGHCKEMSLRLHDIMDKDKDVNFVFKELPIFGGASEYAAKMALAVYQIDPSKYMDFHLKLFHIEGGFNEKSIDKALKETGLNLDKVKKAMKSKAVEEQLKENFELAKKLGIMGTPTLVVSDKSMTKFDFVPGAVPEAKLQSLIEGMQQK